MLANKKLKVVKTLWGIPCSPEVISDLPSVYNGFEASIQHIELIGGLDREKFVAELKTKGLEFVSQIHTCQYPVKKYTVQEHFESFKEECNKSINDWNAIMINSHSGYDGWSLDESIEFFKLCTEFEKTLSIKVVHETHRQRALYSPFQSLAILKACPDLKVNLDFSHWVVVAERMFQEDEKFWKELLPILKNQCHLIHARVSSCEQMQVTDPLLPENKEYLDYFTGVWKSIVDASSDQVFYFTSEFGPQPYMMQVPGSLADVTDLNQININIGKHVRQVIGGETSS